MNALSPCQKPQGEERVALRIERPRPLATILSSEERQAALALARAVMPQTGVLPEASAGAVLRAEDWLHDVPMAAGGYRSLLKAFGVYVRVVTGKRLDAVDPERLSDLCRRFTSGDIGSRYFFYTLTAPLKSAYFDDREVYRRLGLLHRSPPSQARPVSKVPDELPRWADARTSEAWNIPEGEVLECDAVVVGSGAGGAVAAYELAKAGHSVVLLEEGLYYGRKDFTHGAFHLQKYLYRELGASLAIGNSFIPIPVGRTVGGSTTVNSGTCYRLPDRVFAAWQKDHGLDALTPESMDPFFSRVEEVLGVAQARRSLLAGSEPIATGCERLGIQQHGPLFRNAPDCDGQGLCCFGCPTDAKRSTNVSFVPMALQAGMQLLVGAHVDRVLLAQGRAVGVAVTAVSAPPSLKKRPQFTVRAKAVVVAGGTLMTPVLLLQDAETRRALGRSGALGDHMTIHPALCLRAVMPTVQNAHTGIPQGYAVEAFHDEGILMEGAFVPPELSAAAITLVGKPFMDIMGSFNRHSCFGFLVEDKGQGRVRPGPLGRPLIEYNLSQHDVDRLQRGAGLVSRMFLAAGAEQVLTCIPSMPVVRRQDEVDRLVGLALRPRDFELTAYHPLGTARMGRDSRSSVVNQDLRAHDVSGLYICDGSVLPTSPAVNPQVTIMALAMRAARRLAADL